MTASNPVPNEAPVYLDNAATTRVTDDVARAVLAAMTVDFGNPSSAHRLGGAAARRLEEARERVARAIGGEPADVYFTSGGTEANALGVLGAAELARGRHVVASSFEHPSVLEAARRLVERRGFELSLVTPDASGVIDAARVVEAVRAETAIVAVMAVQNELGTIQPVFEIARRVKAKAPRAHVHVDGVQALGKVPLDVAAGPIDSLAISAHKIHGPKGVGALWLRRGARVQSLTVGGGQEKGVRPGTENLPGAIGLGLAAELAVREREANAARWRAMKRALVDGARSLDGTLRVNGDPDRTAPHVLSLGFRGIPAEPLLHALEARSVFVSAGSACAAKSKKPSAALAAVGVPDDVGVIRISFSRDTPDDAPPRALAALSQALSTLRR